MQRLSLGIFIVVYVGTLLRIPGLISKSIAEGSADIRPNTLMINAIVAIICAICAGNLFKGRSPIYLLNPANTFQQVIPEALRLLIVAILSAMAMYATSLSMLGYWPALRLHADFATAEWLKQYGLALGAIIGSTGVFFLLGMKLAKYEK